MQEIFYLVRSGCQEELLLNNQYNICVSTSV